MWTRNRPVVLPEIALPAVVSGLMWGAGNAFWFVANEKLGFVIAFPVILSGPGIVASLWSIFYLRELRGARNYLLVFIIAALLVSSATLLAMSRA